MSGWEVVPWTNGRLMLLEKNGSRIACFPPGPPASGKAEFTMFFAISIP